jgi:hypothetical protein
VTTIMGLMNQIEEGEIVLPAIQRDFVWSEAQTERLLDSVMRSYPIGLILLWETYNNIQYRRFVTDFRSGVLHTYNENRRKRRLRVVLDGQQRLQSLFVALRGKRDGKALYFDVLSGAEDDDLSDERYLFDFKTAGDVKRENRETIDGARPAEERNGEILYWWVAVGHLFAMGAAEKQDYTKEVVRRLQLSSDEELLLARNLAGFDDVLTKDQNILKASTIDEDLASDSPYRKTETDVVEIFVRVNREGTRLTRSELIFSMLKLNWKESAEGLPEFVASVNEGNSFELDTDFVVRCLFAVSELGGRLDIDLLRNKQNVAGLQRNFEQCCDAIRATIDFVHTECKIASSDLLGTSSTLVPIVYYLFHRPRFDVPNSQAERLRTAIYLLGLARPFSRYSESRIGNFVRTQLRPLVDQDSNVVPLEAAIQRVRQWERISSVENLAQSNVDLTLHLIQGLSGAKVQYKRNAPEVDHIFPRAELRKKDYEEEEINDLANFWILAQGKNRNKSNKHPKRYFDDVGKRQLQKALIDPELLDYRRYRSFLAKRGEALTKRVASILDLSDDDVKRAE